MFLRWLSALAIGEDVTHDGQIPNIKVTSEQRVMAAMNFQESDRGPAPCTFSNGIPLYKNARLTRVGRCVDDSKMGKNFYFDTADAAETTAAS